MIEGVLLTVTVEYALGALCFAIAFVVSAPWRVLDRASPARKSWRYRWYAHILDGFLTALLWPAVASQIFKEGL